MDGLGKSNGGAACTYTDTLLDVPPARPDRCLAPPRVSGCGQRRAQRSGTLNVAKACADGLEMKPRRARVAIAADNATTEELPSSTSKLGRDFSYLRKLFQARVRFLLQRATDEGGREGHRHGRRQYHSWQQCRSTPHPDPRPRPEGSQSQRARAPLTEATVRRLSPTALNKLVNKIGGFSAIPASLHFQVHSRRTLLYTYVRHSAISFSRHRPFRSSRKSRLSERCSQTMSRQRVEARGAES